MWPHVSMWSGWWWVVGRGSLWHRDMVSPRGTVSLNSACQGLPGLTLVSSQNADTAYRVADQSSPRSTKPFNASNIEASQLGSRAQASVAVGVM